MDKSTRKKRVLLLFGGESHEHDVSLISAQNIYNALNMDRIEPLLCYIDRHGSWWHTTSISAQNTTEAIIPIPGASAVKVGGIYMPIDVIFPVLHGTNGEDGTVQGLARLLHTPIVGCGIDGSAICMDKVLAKQLLAAAHIPVVPFQIYQAKATLPNFTVLTQKLGPVLFVKPARQGSSVGVSKVRSAAEFSAAIELALRYDSEILIEAAVDKAREIEIAVLGPTDSPEVSGAGEVIPDRDFYDYESKYDSASTSEIRIPAVITPAQATKAQAMARKAFSILRCRGLARVDFLLGNDGILYLNEVNTMPGFTNISMYPKLWEADGYSYQQLVEKLISGAS